MIRLNLDLYFARSPRIGFEAVDIREQVVAVREVRVTEFGDPDVLVAGEGPAPVAGVGEVVVEVAFADVLFVEAQVRSGWGREFFPVRPPYVPGGGVSGVVTSTGHGVDQGWSGARVVAHTGGYGAYAEQVAVAGEALIHVPDEVDLRDAAALLHDGPTALALFEGAAIRPDDQVLITGAGGGMGVLLVQLAHATGARVVGAVGSTQKRDLVLRMGADEVVDHTQPDWTRHVLRATGGEGPTVVFDGVGGQIGRSAFDVTARGGRFSAHGAASGGFAEVGQREAERNAVALRGIQDVQFGPVEHKRWVERSLDALADGRVRPVIGATFPLDRACDAHTAIESRRVAGKALLFTRSADAITA